MDNAQHATQKDFDSYVELINNSDMLLSDKESCQRILAAAFKNTNGDPPEEKQKMMCQFDFELAKQIIHIRAMIASLLKGLKDRSAAGSRSGVWGLVERCRNQIAFVLVAAFFAPHSLEVIRYIMGVVK